ncbi:hypothetical protein LG943_16935 [Streptomonospora sp. S1-112]|uniref:Secreted protein n=1 Tax=Streptomonospora mangrovi TaxID=2883123 RepID=A0A9X3NLM1_9ACTN|nr:hypothetical protein [Streptomonospora mangrovi]MDA0565987.1 hypothetical protein [Streptomonospora mangrovi]
MSSVVLALPLGAGAPAAASPRSAADGRGWIQEDLARADAVGARGGAGGLRTAVGTAPGASLRTAAAPAPGAVAVFPAHGLARPASAVDVRAEATAGAVLLEARGVRADGMWTEWRSVGPITVPAGAARSGEEVGGRVRLPEPVDRVQVRVGFGAAEPAGAAAVLESVRLRPVQRTAPEEPSAAPEGESSSAPGGAEGERPADRPFSARVFATRIGHVGGTTANGHTVRENDHFVALPSRRGLSGRGAGDYTVRVCAEDGERRCAYAPVWDVGPWNIRDDHWNAEREEWRDLPRGLPQAQAAYEDGHNGGRDGFGREVANPAGIDLADGTFRDGLKLPTNAWVRVDYLWTAGYDHPASITAAPETQPVPVRAGPGMSHAERGVAAHAAAVDVVCRVPGDEVTGPQGASDVWFAIGAGDYVPAANVSGGDSAPTCREGEGEGEGADGARDGGSGG